MQHKITISATQSESGSGSGPTITGTTYNAGSVASSIDVTLGVVTDSAVPLAFTVANLQSVVMLATKDCTIKVNSTTAPTSTIGLKAGSPLVYNGDYFSTANPFSGTTTVANLYVTTTSSTRLQVLVISN